MESWSWEPREGTEAEHSPIWAETPPKAPQTLTLASSLPSAGVLQRPYDQGGVSAPQEGNLPFSARSSEGRLCSPSPPRRTGRGACVPLALPLTVVPAPSTLIYGAIWCQVIAHQYPIYHPACHGLWLLFHKAKAFEKEPVTQDRKRT